MADSKRVWCLVFGVWCLMFLHAGTAAAGPIWDWMCGNPCPPPTYCPARYWAPNMARAYDCLCGPHISVYAPDRHPEVPATVTVFKYRCKPAPPDATEAA